MRESAPGECSLLLGCQRRTHAKLNEEKSHHGNSRVGMLNTGQKHRCGNRLGVSEEQKGGQCAWRTVKDGRETQEPSRGQSILSLTEHAKEFGFF